MSTYTRSRIKYFCKYIIMYDQDVKICITTATFFIFGEVQFEIEEAIKKLKGKGKIIDN